MPTRFLSDAEIMRLEGFPEAIERRDLARYFHLDGEDVAFVRGQRGAPNQLGMALQEYGRLIKTNFVLAWLADEELRQRIGRELNKGERLHALRRAVFYANEGHVRQRTSEQQGEQALCLAIVVNPIIAWNTVYTQRVLDELRAAGELITTSEIEHISPLARQHIHLYGHYPFDLATRPHGHRPLRTRHRRRRRSTASNANRMNPRRC